MTPRSLLLTCLFCAIATPVTANQSSTDQYLSSVTSAATNTMKTPADASAAGPIAGEMFGQSVSATNYYFAKRVAYMFARPWGGADLPEGEREAFVWEQLLLHFEGFRRGLQVTEEELDQTVNQFLKDQQLTFTRRQDPEAYRQWLDTHVSESVELFENQIRYLVQIRKLREQALAEQQVTVTEDEMLQEYLNEHHHVGGEMIVFDTKDAAQAAYERFKTPAAWEAMKATPDVQVRPVSLMTLEAYMDLWGIPKEQIYAFHALEIGAIGPPMPFGKQWCVYRLLEKRVGDVAEFPAVKESYFKQLQSRKQYASLKQWIEQLKQSAHLKIIPGF